MTDTTANAPALTGTAEEMEAFVYLLSHDVKHSVRALMELPLWIREDLEHAGHRIDGSIAERFDLMDTYAARLDRMLSDLLIFSRIGRLQEVAAVPLDRMIDTVLSELPVPGSFRVRRDLRLPRVTMGTTDARTMLTVLLSNAVKHHDAGGGVIRIGTCAIRGGVLIRVQDDGPGIASEHREKVFRPMVTLRSRDEVEGSGMGLAILRKIATHYGGTCRIADLRKDRGTRIELRLPQ